MKELLLKLVVIAVALISVSEAAKLCVNANSVISAVYVNGVDNLGSVRNAGDVQKCNCFKISGKTSVIAIEAYSRKDPYLRTIQACLISNQVTYQDWRCKSIGPRMVNRMRSWMNPDYDDSKWPLARYKRCYQRCRNRANLPCNMPKSTCFWADRMTTVKRNFRESKDLVRCRLNLCTTNCLTCDQEKVAFSCDPQSCRDGFGTKELALRRECKPCAENCRKCIIKGAGSCDPRQCELGYGPITDQVTGLVGCKQCAYRCTDCKIAGAGSCESDSCIVELGVDTNKVTGKVVCVNKCHLEIISSDPMSATDQAYMQITDLYSNSVDTWNASTEGLYIAKIEMTTCTFTNKLSSDWNGASDLMVQASEEWTYPEVVAYLGVDHDFISSGFDASDEPLAMIYNLVSGQNTEQYGGENHINVTADLQGVQHGDVLVSNLIAVPFV